MHELDGNLIIDETVAADAYTEGSSDPSPTEVDIKDCQNVKLAVSAGTINSTSDGLVVELHGADASGGSFAVMSDKDGDDAKVTLTSAGIAEVEVPDPQRYVKASVTQETSTQDNFCAMVIAGNGETYPLE